MDERKKQCIETERSYPRNRITASVNSMKEDIFLYEYSQTRDSILFMSMAGTTYPNPGYFVNRKLLREYENMYVLEYVVSGKGYIEVDDRKYTVEAGDFYMINRYIMSHYYADKDEPYEKIWVNVNGMFMNALVYAYRITAPVLIVHSHQTEQYIRKLHECIKRHLPNGVSNGNDEMMHILLDLFQHIDVMRKSETISRNTVEFNLITEHIRENIRNETLSVESMSDYFYISYPTLYRLCMKNTGLSPKHYILKLKIDYAKDLFLNCNFSVAKVSEILNFSSPVYFRKVFKKYVGVSPMEWKRSKLIEANSKENMLSE